MHKRVGKRVRELRRAREWTQLMLAEQVTLSRASITNIEAGRQPVSLNMAVMFSVVFEVTPQEFMEGLWDG